MMSGLVKFLLHFLRVSTLIVTALSRVVFYVGFRVYLIQIMIFVFEFQSNTNKGIEYMHYVSMIFTRLDCLVSRSCFVAKTLAFHHCIIAFLDFFHDV